MTMNATTLKRMYWVVVLASFTVVTAMLFTYTPVEKTMGSVQKVFYVHFPAALCALLACLVSFVGAIGYLGKRQMAWDDLSAAGAKVRPGRISPTARCRRKAVLTSQVSWPRRSSTPGPGTAW